MNTMPEHNPNIDGPAPDSGTPVLSWAVLLARWTRFAQTAVALPADDQGAAWRNSIPSIITLQAVTFALADLLLLPVDERPLAVDRAGVLITTHTRDLTIAWRAQDMPQGVQEIIDDAKRTHAAAKVLLTSSSDE